MRLFRVFASVPVPDAPGSKRCKRWRKGAQGGQSTEAYKDQNLWHHGFWLQCLPEFEQVSPISTDSCCRHWIWRGCEQCTWCVQLRSSEILFCYCYCYCSDSRLFEFWELTVDSLQFKSEPDSVRFQNPKSKISWKRWTTSQKLSKQLCKMQPIGARSHREIPFLWIWTKIMPRSQRRRTAHCHPSWSMIRDR